MARLWYSGAEFADRTAEGLTVGSGTVTYDTGTVRTGSRAFKVDAGAGNAVQHVYRDFNGAVGTTYYARAYFRSPDTPSANAGVLDVQDSAGAVIVRVRYTTGLRLNLIDSAAANLVTGPVTTPGTWYRVEVKVKVGAGATDECELLVDGTSYGALTAQTLSDNAPDRLAFGWLTAPGASKVAFFEDIALNDDTGTDENGYPGDGKVLILLPTADSAVGTGWTVGNGSTAVSTNLFGGVDNVPPAGVADAAGAASQIRNASNTSTANYDATTQTTLAAGMPSGSTIRVLQVVGVFGCSSTTATNAGIGSTGVSPNTGVATVAADTGAVAGTHPTGWARRESTVVYSATTSTPGVRVGKRTGTTRVVLCSLAAILIDYREPTDVTITAVAGSATASATAPTGIVQPAPSAGMATGDGIAPVGVVRPIPPAALGTGAGVAPAGVVTKAGAAGLATASGAAPTGIVRPVPSAASATGSGIAPTSTATIGGAAGTGSGSGVAPVGIAAPVAVAALAAGSAPSPTGLVVGVASVALASGSTGAQTGVVVIVATAGGAVGVATVPTIGGQPVVIPVPAAFGNGAAVAPDASVVAVAGSAVAVGFAVVPASWITIAGATGFADGSATAPTALVVVVPTAGFAVGDAIVPGWSGAVPVVIYLPASATWRRVAGPSAVLVSSRARAALAAQPHPSAGLATSRPSADVVGVPFPSATLTKGDQP